MVVSGYLTTDTTVAVVRAGADVVVDKPIRPREVLKRLFGDAPKDIEMQDTPTLEDAIESHIARVYAGLRRQRVGDRAPARDLSQLAAAPVAAQRRQADRLITARSA